MTPDSHPEIEARLVSLRQFLSTCPPHLHGARLIQYRGVDLLASLDVAVADIEHHVAGSMGEGLRVDWIVRNRVLYLRVVDADAAPPSWERLFAEQELADVRSALREAGLGSADDGT